MRISNNLPTTNYLSRENIAREMGFKFNDINEILSNDMGYGMSFPEYARLDRKAQAAAMIGTYIHYLALQRAMKQKSLS
ncbi:hypothetical protein [Campylobacter concisus]|uniref:hypothetical protein n=1 Tax=Campylobacter concisus TaxID=199 RepID=UPI0018A90F29|nr:hypothetical protein [Campylobacter concisus]